MDSLDNKINQSFGRERRHKHVGEGVGAMSNDNKTTAARKASAVEEETSMREESLIDNTAETTREVRRCPRV